MDAASVSHNPVIALQTPGQKHYDQNNEQYSSDPDSTPRPEGIITAATTKQQKQD
jgi:hypothetical protein